MTRPADAPPDPDVPRWGLVTTAKASPGDILDFAAHHLDIGAARLFVYLDAPSPEAEAALHRHPLIDVTVTDDAYWQARLGRRPPKHQNRQGRNAEHAYARAKGIDWLAHIDIDEYLWPETPLAAQLGALAPDCPTARIRPAEALAPGPDSTPGLTCFKAWIPADGQRDALVRDIYPNYGAALNGGFLSHLAGKLLVRTGLGALQFRIHNVLRDKTALPGAELAATSLLHLHAHDYADWYARFRYRLEKGAYRDELKNTLPLHRLFRQLDAEHGEAGLRAFFDEVCRETPALRARLDRHGLLRCHRLELASKRQRHFPG